MLGLIKPTNSSAALFWKSSRKLLIDQIQILRSKESMSSWTDQASLFSWNNPLCLTFSYLATSPTKNNDGPFNCTPLDRMILPFPTYLQHPFLLYDVLLPFGGMETSVSIPLSNFGNQCQSIRTHDYCNYNMTNLGGSL